MQKIRIDFDNPGLPQHISAVENDAQSRFFKAVLYKDGKAYTAPEGATYSIMYHGFGPQNQGWYDTINDGAGKRAACTASGNVVTCEIARQALQVPGHVSIVLCVTTGKGYMIKSWPIECDCKNDRYDSTAEIQSFFYITQISNADWNRAIQAVEELKNTIDPTLSLSGKAADAKATGDAVGELKEDLGDLNVKSLGNYDYVYGHLTNNDTWNNLNSNYQHIAVPVKSGDVIITSFETTGNVLAFVKSYNKPVDGATVNYSDAEGYNKKITTAGRIEKVWTVPSDCTYVIVENIVGGNTIGILKFKINEYDYANPLNENIANLPHWIASMATLAATSFESCMRFGYYSFPKTYIPYISDAPADLTYGGIVENIPNFAVGVNMQIITDSVGNKWQRYGNRAFKRLYYDNSNDIIPDWEIGTIDSQTGGDDESTERVRTNNIALKHGIEAVVPDGMKLRAILYYSDSVMDTGWHKKSFYLYPKINENNSIDITHVRFFGGYTTDITITDAIVGQEFVLKYIGSDSYETWYALGDSITQGNYSYSDNKSPTIDTTLNCWSNIAAYAAKLNLVNFGVGGSGYVHNGTVLDKLNARSHVDAINFSKADKVSLAYGVNDWKYNMPLGTFNDEIKTGGTFYSNMRYVIEKILSDNPLAKIKIITPLNCSAYGNQDNNWGLGYHFSNNGTLEDIFKAEKIVAEYYGIELIDNTHTSVVNRISATSCLIDGVHPSLDCHKVLGHEMARKI